MTLDMKPKPKRGVRVQRLVRWPWITYRHTNQDRDGMWLVRLQSGAIHLGTFYCGSFVMDGYSYNETSGMIGNITHLKSVKPPNIVIKHEK